MPSASKSTAALLLLSLLALTAVGAWVYFLQREREPALEPVAEVFAAPDTPPTIAYQPIAIGRPVEGRPVISHLLVYDLDADGLLDVLVCDATANRIGWIRQSPRGEFTETWLGEPVPAPARVAVGDLNQDGHPDLLVASLGSILPTDDRIGRVVVLENLGDQQFRNRVIADTVLGVSDVRATDLNDDGRADLIVAHAGATQGDLRWWENRGAWEFVSHALPAQGAAIAAPTGDFDGDGRAEIAVLFSRGEGRVQLYRRHRDEMVSSDAGWTAPSRPWRGSGLETCDLNGDGRHDLLVATGDGFNPDFAAPARGDGWLWLEPRGGTFESRASGELAGCYSPIAVDLDGDADLDVVAASAFNHAIDPDAVGLVAWINDGRQNFRRTPLARDPTRLIAVAAGDLDGTGTPVLVTGGFHAYPPFTRMSRVTLWRRGPPMSP